MMRNEITKGSSGETIATIFRKDQPVMRVVFEPFGLVGMSVHVWWEALAPIGVCELRYMKKHLPEITGARYFCNVDSRNKVNMRFAQVFGFTETSRAGYIAIMERNS